MEITRSGDTAFLTLPPRHHRLTPWGADPAVALDHDSVEFTPPQPSCLDPLTLYA